MLRDAAAIVTAENLDAVCAWLNQLPLELRDVTTDSREAREGFVFLAYPGSARDGREFVGEAVARGASAVIVEADGWEPFSSVNLRRVPCIALSDLRAHASAIAGHVYRHPSDALCMIGVTGTNGKTSVSQWIAAAMHSNTHAAAVIGTIGNGIVGALTEANNTTPDAAALQRMLRQYVDAGVRSVAMEVSSHGLHQGRVAAVKYDIGVFTNLTRDHLDYHGTMEAYGEAKAALFRARGMHTAVINVDDAFGRVLADRCAGQGLRVIRTACNGGSALGDLVASNVAVSSAGVSFLATHKASGVSVRIESDILGAFNVANLLSVMGALLAAGLALEEIAKRIERLRPVAGRMQTVRAIDSSKSLRRPLVVVDYAHTPDALEKLLSTVASIVPEGGRLISVFGCGGNRDRGKRPLMGAVSARFAEFTVVTSDNPRQENPEAIIADITPALAGAAHRVVVDRQQAIFEALNSATAQDIVVIAGKGHESYQIVGTEKLQFSDVDVAQEALGAWTGQGESAKGGRAC